MIEAIVLFYAAWKVEIFIGLFLVALPILRKHYRDNVLVATMIDLTTARIANAMELDDPEANPRDTKSRAARRKAVRKEMGKASRKANRGTGKGSKKGGGKVK
jgi:RES domain-containing protein